MILDAAYLKRREDKILLAEGKILRKRAGCLHVHREMSVNTVSDAQVIRAF